MARNAIASEFWTSNMAHRSEMRSKVIFGHPKWPTTAILSKISQKIKLRFDLKWPEMRSKVNFGYPKWPFCKKIPKKINSLLI